MKHPVRDMSDHVTKDPNELLRIWLSDARAAASQHDTMTLATASADGAPSARIVLLRGLDDRGLTFFTNRTSRKAEELEANPRAAAVLHWPELDRQVRIEGSVERTSDEESEDYWSTRPRGSQLAAWASRQSTRLQDRAVLEAQVADARARFDGEDVPLPPFWGGYRIVPETIEFWTHRDDRLHERIRFVRQPAGWRWELLAP